MRDQNVPIKAISAWTTGCRVAPCGFDAIGNAKSSIPKRKNERHWQTNTKIHGFTLIYCTCSLTFLDSNLSGGPLLATGAVLAAVLLLLAANAQEGRFLRRWGGGVPAAAAAWRCCRGRFGFRLGLGLGLTLLLEGQHDAMAALTCLVV